MSNSEKQLSQKSASIGQFAILMLSFMSLLFVFQPFSKVLFMTGCVTVIVSGLVFNLMPFIVAGNTLKSVVKAALIILLVFTIVVCLSIFSAWGYTVYLQNK